MEQTAVIDSRAYGIAAKAADAGFERVTDQELFGNPGYKPSVEAILDTFLPNSEPVSRADIQAHHQSKGLVAVPDNAEVDNAIDGLVIKKEEVQEEPAEITQVAVPQKGSTFVGKVSKELQKIRAEYRLKVWTKAIAEETGYSQRGTDRVISIAKNIYNENHKPADQYETAVRLAYSIMRQNENISGHIGLAKNVFATLCGTLDVDARHPAVSAAMQDARTLHAADALYRKVQQAKEAKTHDPLYTSVERLKQETQTHPGRYGSSQVYAIEKALKN